MKNTIYSTGMILVMLLSACQQVKDREKDDFDLSPYSEEDFDRLGITDPEHLSTASIRALQWTKWSNEWFVEFQVFDLEGDLAYEEGVVRRDPSAVLKIEDRYYVWYSRSTGPTQGFGGDIETEKVFPWDRCDIWYATSIDGITWQEKGLAVPRGPKGAYDDRSVFTVEVMGWDLEGGGRQPLSGGQERRF